MLSLGGKCISSVSPAWLGIQRRSLSLMSKTTLDLAISVMEGSRSALAKSITLVESTRDDHREQAALMLNYIAANKHKFANILPNEKRLYNQQTLRLGIAGPPGAGKSTFIEALGMNFVNEQFKVAVIPVDPSSHISGGSILGDKTRMEKLSRSDLAYVRASPTSGVLGGIAEHTSDVISLCEACHYDIIIVESVGLGQSEVDIDMAVDMLLVIVPPGGGDSLQASKKGIMEAADMIVINKADGDLLSAAKHTKADYAGAMYFVRQKHINWTTPVLMMSAATGLGVEEVEENIKNFHKLMVDCGKLQQKRGNQAIHWMWGQLQRLAIHHVEQHEVTKLKSSELTPSVQEGCLTPRAAALQILNSYLRDAVDKHH